MKKPVWTFMCIVAACVAAVMLIAASPLPAWAGFSFRDPEIPDNERLTYRSHTEGQASIISEKVIVQKDGNRELYEITSNSPSVRTAQYITFKG